MKKKAIMSIMVAVLVCAVATTAVIAVRGRNDKAADSANSGLYAPIPSNRNMMILRYSSNEAIAIYLNTFKVEGEFTFKKYSQYKNYFPVFCATQTDTTNNKQLETVNAAGFVTSDGSVKLTFNLNSYKHGSRSWLVPATYSVHVWCQPSATITKPIVDICTFTFQVNEQGFINADKSQFSVNGKDEGAVSNV
jgi:flagellar basal body-associated protein FliL